jgi:ubiquinone/menaquinone biosynthesis C-methylase UbiE
MPELTHAQARAFYDRFGSRQDLQRFYEDAALERLLANAALRQAHAVVEFGCGTGRLAARMLDELLPLDATYLGYDVSPTMVELARARLTRFGSRARVAQTDGSPALPLADGVCDRFVSTYVFDLLSRAERRAVAEEARRVLVRDGRLCLASLAPGTGPFSRVIQAFWQLAWRLRPQLVGGCQPVQLTALIGPHWRTLYRDVVCRLGLCSEVLIAGLTPAAECSNTNDPSTHG